jgi:hypothetical protein
MRSVKFVEEMYVVVGWKAVGRELQKKRGRWMAKKSWRRR